MEPAVYSVWWGLGDGRKIDSVFLICAFKGSLWWWRSSPENGAPL